MLEAVMNGQYSNVSLRILGPRQNVLDTTGDGDALANQNTTILPDGACCFVLQNRSNYRLNKTSSAAPSGLDIVVPTSGGPGRWFRDVPVVDKAALVFEGDIAYDEIEVGAPSIAVVANTWHAQPASAGLYFDITPGTPSGVWSIDDDTGRITYTGADQMFRVSMDASITSVDTANERLDMAISLNNALLTTTTNDFTSSQAFVNPDGAESDGEGGIQIQSNPDEDVFLHVERLLVLTSGDNLRAMFRDRSNNGHISVTRLHFVITPV